MRLARRRRTDPERPLRVAQICGATDGALWMVQISEGLKALGYDVIAIIGSPDGDTARRLEAAGIPYAAMPQPIVSASPVLGRLGTVPHLWWLRFPFDGLALLRVSGRMARILRRHEIDITHTHVISSILVGRIAAFMARVPMRTAMIPGPYHLEAPWLRRADMATQWMDHRLIPGAQRTDDLYAQLGVPARRRRVVGYGVDATTFDPAKADGARVRAELGIAPDAPLIGQVAYFYPVPPPGGFTPPEVAGRGVKGHEDMVEAARLVVAQRPDARFLFVGGGWGPAGTAHKEDIERRVHEAGLDHAVTFTGHRTDIPDVLAALDVSVQASLSENYGGTLESLLMRAPTIATRVGGMPEAVRHEETGLLVDPGAPDQLAAAMLRLIEDRELAARLGAAGRELMLERFTTETMIAGVDAVYRELARERSIQRPPVGG